MTFDADLALLLAWIRALQSVGTPAHRMEESLGALARHLELEADFFVLPTAIIATLRREGHHRTHVIRQGAGEPDLELQDELGSLLREFLVGRLERQGVAFRLEQLMRGRPAPGALHQLLAAVLVASAAAGALGGGWREMLLALPLGLLTGALGLLAMKRPTLARILPALAALAVAALARLARPVGSEAILLLAGLIVFFPGLKLLVSLNELAAGHLAAGSARLADVAITLIQLAFGAALGHRLGEVLLPGGAIHAVAHLPEALHHLPLAALALGLLMAFRARLRDYPWVLAGCLTAFFGARLGAEVLDPQFGATLGAFAVTFGSNLLCRLTGRTPALTLLPGLMVLVPGSLGFRGLAAIFQNEMASGLDTAFRMLFLAASLLFGVLLANLASPEPRRI